MGEETAESIKQQTPGLREFADANELSDETVRSLHEMWSTTRGNKNFSQDAWQTYYVLLQGVIRASK